MITISEFSSVILLLHKRKIFHDLFFEVLKLFDFADKLND